jgi:hypothetical protein
MLFLKPGEKLEVDATDSRIVRQMRSGDLVETTAPLGTTAIHDLGGGAPARSATPRRSTRRHRRSRHRRAEGELSRDRQHRHPDVAAPPAVVPLVRVHAGRPLARAAAAAPAADRHAEGRHRRRGTIYPINDPQETDALFGVGSPLALMCRKASRRAASSARARSSSPSASPSPAAARAHADVTVTGPATASGNVVIRIAGRTLTIGVASGDAQNTIAAAINAAIGAQKTLLPVTAGVAANVVTCTHVAKGVGGNDVVYEVVSTPPASPS